MPYDFVTYGNIKGVQFIPKIKAGGTKKICPKSSVEADKIGVCA